VVLIFCFAENARANAKWQFFREFIAEWVSALNEMVQKNALQRISQRVAKQE
jgi:hypothetical protein